MIAQPTSLFRSLLMIAALASGGVACSSAPETRPVSSTHTGSAARVGGGSTGIAPARTTLGERAAAVALEQVGVPYRYGGASPSGFDCSGLVHYSYSHAGKALPRTTAGLWAELAPVETGGMRAGDLLFFSIEGKMSHVGMYLGGGRFVHAPSSGRAVSIESLDSDFYRHALIRAGRPR